MRPIALALSLVTLVFAAACTTSTSPLAETSDASPDSPSSADAAPDSPDAAPSTCTAPLSGFHCPATFDAAGAPGSCPPYAMNAQIGACGGSLVFDFVIGASETWCFYDPSSKALIGARFVDDVPDLCGNTTNEAVAGHVEGSCAIADAGAVQCVGDAAAD